MSDQRFDPQERITRHHSGCEPQPLMRWKGVDCSLGIGKEFVELEQTFKRLPFRVPNPLVLFSAFLHS